MRSYGQYCPVARAAEILGDRWTLLILRDMHTGVRHFNELHRGLPGISRSVLTQRLRRLEHDGLIERRVDARGRTVEYGLSAAGDDLSPVLATMSDWVNDWVMDDPTPAELDPRLLMLWFSRVIDLSTLGGRRLVMEFHLEGPRPGRSWIVVEDDEPSLCLDDPCLDVDLVVEADTATLYKVFMGRLKMTSAVADGLVEFRGTPSLRRAFQRVLDRTTAPYLRKTNIGRWPELRTSL